MAKKSGGVIGKILLVIVLLLVIGGAVACVYHFTDGGTTEFKRFYLVHGGKDLMQPKSSMRFSAGSEQRFDVKYTFDLGITEAKEYSVKIVPNEEETFSFTVGERRLAWRETDEMADLSAFFSLEAGERSFTFYLPQLMTVKTVLSSLYPGEEVTVAGADALLGKALYKLVAVSYDGKVTYEIAFSVLPHEVEGVEPDTESYVFSGDTYRIGYSASRYGFAQSGQELIRFEAPAFAAFGEEVTFTGNVNLDGCGIESVEIWLGGALYARFTEDDSPLGVTHSFSMPSGSVMIRFYLR